MNVGRETDVPRAFKETSHPMGPLTGPDGHLAVGVLAGRRRRSIILPDCCVTKCQNLSLTTQLQAMREKTGKKNKRERERQEKRGLDFECQRC